MWGNYGQQAVVGARLGGRAVAVVSINGWPPMVPGGGQQVMAGSGGNSQWGPVAMAGGKRWVVGER